MKIVIIGLALALYGNVVCAKDRIPYIDLVFEKHEKEIDRLIMDCEKQEKNMIKKFGCTDKIKARFSNDLVRGHTLYCEKNYIEAGLDLEALKGIFYRLKEAQKSARREHIDFNYQEYRKAGEVTAEMFQSEILCVESRLAKIQIDNINKMKKANSSSY